MKKIGILTINGNHNCGNKLQNYALKIYLEKMGFNVETVWIEKKLSKIISFIKNIIKRYLLKDNARYLKFIKFNNEYLNVKYYTNNQISNKYDYFIVGSDQVWNYNFKEFNQNMFLSFSPQKKNIAYAASFGVDKIEDKFKNIFIQGLKNIKYISVRENQGQEIIKNLMNFKPEILIDPTMLIEKDEWDKISTKPKELKTEKYILTYFLGNISKEKRKEIEKIAQENNCEIIELLNKKSPFYSCGPKEFIYLEKNAFLICTDSFHSSIFALLYNIPLIIFDRDDNEKNMNSRLETFITKFQLENHKFTDKITNDNLKYNYTKAHKTLAVEKDKSRKFLEKALNIK